MIACAKWLGREPDTCTRGEGCVCKTERRLSQRRSRTRGRRLNPSMRGPSVERRANIVCRRRGVIERREPELKKCL